MRIRSSLGWRRQTLARWIPQHTQWSREMFSGHSITPLLSFSHTATTLAPLTHCRSPTLPLTHSEQDNYSSGVIDQPFIGEMFARRTPGALPLY